MKHTTINGDTNVWKDVLGEIENKVGIRKYKLWLQNLQLLSINDKTVSIGVPNLFIQSKVRDNFETIIRESIKNIIKINPSISYLISNNGKSIKDQITYSKPANTNNEIKKKTIETNSRKLLLEDYVIGDCNRLAYAAALEISKPGPVSYNTLFLHGAIGVGKTHLLQGIWNRLNEESNAISAVYMPAENWTNEFIYSLKSGKLETFRNKYRKVDMFLVDDVHFLSNKKGVQEEFLHTFNTLQNLSKRIVFASDAHPRLIGQLKESLLSRFMSGMIAKIDQPSFNTSLQILRAKTSNIRKKIPDNVLEFISEKFNENVRSMESALTTVLAHANVNKVKIDMKLACDALRDLYVSPKKNITLKDIENVIVAHYNVTRANIHSKSKSRNVVLSRQLCMYLAKTLTNASFQEIGSYFGDKRHTTAIFAINKIKGEIKNNVEFRLHTDDLIKKINNKH